MASYQPSQRILLSHIAVTMCGRTTHFGCGRKHPRHPPIHRSFRYLQRFAAVSSVATFHICMSLFSIRWSRRVGHDPPKFEALRASLTLQSLRHGSRSRKNLRLEIVAQVNFLAQVAVAVHFFQVDAFYLQVGFGIPGLYIVFFLALIFRPFSLFRVYTQRNRIMDQTCPSFLRLSVPVLLNHRIDLNQI